VTRPSYYRSANNSESSRTKALRLTIVQYAGDYKEAFERFAQGGKETYHAQRYSVNVVGSLAQQLEQVAVVCALSETKYDVVLDNGVRAVGAGLSAGFRPSELLPQVEKTKPTLLSVTTPIVPILKWANNNQIPTIVPLADSFRKQGFRAAFRHRQLAYHLNRPNIQWVGNHGINACLSLVDIGVSPDKIVPWDWPPSHQPSDYTPRLLRKDLPSKLLYVGSVTEAKGVGDLLQAMSLLKKQGARIRLSVIGRDPDGTMIALAQSLELSKLVDFLGIVPNEEIPSAMRNSDAIVIPSRHEYPEGLPLTIYEALAARTPIIASDHPMFREALVNRESALIFRAGNPAELANAAWTLLQDPSLYQALSLRSEAAWNRLRLPVTMGELLEAWISNDPLRQKWLYEHRFGAGLYDDRIREMRKLGGRSR
jgi:glycosyltransferase involved in cell wall biosynthesis